MAASGVARFGAALALVAAIALVAPPRIALDRSDELSVPGGIGLAVFLEPASRLFGDPVKASAEVILDPERIDADSVELRTNFAPYRLAGPVSRIRSSSQGVVRFRYGFRLLCLRPACRPPVGTVRSFRFSAATVTFDRLAVDRPGRLSMRWYPLTIASRLTSETANRAELQGREYPPPALTYSVSSSRLSQLLYGLALLLALAGGWLLWRALAPLVVTRLTGRRLARFRPIAREVALLRDAVERGEADAQRKALDGLAVALGGNGSDDLAHGAKHLAWCRGGATSSEALALADEVESRMAEEVRR